jgi:hypothetical protein
MYARKPLFPYNDEDFGVCFYYTPASEIEQDFYRESYPEFDSPYIFLEEIFHEYVELCEIEVRGEKQYIVWPEDEFERSEYLQQIDKGHVIEVGAAILGWLRDEDEDPDDFIDRIFSDIQNAVSSVRRDS